MGCTDRITYTVLAKGREVNKYERQKNKSGRTDDRKDSTSLFHQSPAQVPIFMNENAPRRHENREVGQRRVAGDDQNDISNSACG
jgi:hypothetical protein